MIPSLLKRMPFLALSKGGFTNGDTVLSDWSISTTEPCSGGWTGITCNAGDEVATVDLRKCNMFLSFNQ